MPSEIIDIVNEQNQVIGQIEKDLAHKEGQLHRCIIAQLIDSKGNWTLVKQAADRQDAGQFVSPVGGHIRSGESEVEALYREAFEELGLTEFTYKRIGQTIFNREVIGRKENHLYIVYEIFADTKPVLNHESVGFDVFTQPALQQQLDTDPDKFGAAFHHVINECYPHLRQSRRYGVSS